MSNYIALLKEGTNPPLFDHIYILKIGKDPHRSKWYLVYFPGYGTKDNFRNIKHEMLESNTPEECLDQFFELTKQCPACKGSGYITDKYGHCGDRLSKAFTKAMSSLTNVNITHVIATADSYRNNKLNITKGKLYKVQFEQNTFIAIIIDDQGIKLRPDQFTDCLSIVV